MIVIDAENSIIGRTATRAAKLALLGNEVHIVNCEKAVILGDAKKTAEKIRARRRLGQPTQGPFIQTQPFKYVRRIVRGMLPYSKPRGRAAYARVKCYESIPEALAQEKAIKVEEADKNTRAIIKYITIAQLCRDIRER